MRVRQLLINGAWELTPDQHPDERGVFLEQFSQADLEANVGRRMPVAQVNCSVSRRGTLRGIHYAEVPPGQAKYVTCLHGAVLDVVVDIRVGSPTFSRWDSVLLDDVDRRAIFIAEGLGHAFMSMSESATISYLCSEPYAPGREHGVDPLDPALRIAWPADLQPLLSAKDAEAPTLSEARDRGMLPSYHDSVACYSDPST
jgi:dTDP-4-dehydrorhamnose 3,5-epimerase